MLRDYGIVKVFETEEQAKAYAAAHPRKIFIYLTKN